jgi:hypothetical protein
VNFPRCKTCKFWVNHPSFGPTCEHEKLGEDISGVDVLTYTYSEGGAFHPGPEFGCVHHEEVVVV